MGSSKAAGQKNPAALFAAMGDETRLWLVARFCSDGPASISALTEGSTMTRQAITKHLRVMEKARLVKCERRGRESVWQLEQRRFEEARRYLDSISKQWDSALARLRRFVEDD